MIHDVDFALGELLRGEAVPGGTDVVFDAPTKDWAARRNTPTIDCFLYDIREDPSRREVMLERRHNAEGRVTEYAPPPRRFKLSYLLTAWTRRPEDEHRLLSQLLSTLLKYDKIPDAYLSGSLEQSRIPVILQLALPTGQDRSLSDIWSALGGELKPSLDLVAIAPLQPGRSYAAGPPVLELPHLHLHRGAAGKPLTPAEQPAEARPRGKPRGKKGEKAGNKAGEKVPRTRVIKEV